MKTKTELIAELKVEYPNLNRGEDEQVIPLTATEYEETISAWADSIINEQLKEQEILIAKAAKIDAIAKLTALGIDPKVFGLEIEQPLQEEIKVDN